jgi:hypothetical protein
VNVGTPILAFTPNADVSRRLTGGLVDLLPVESRARIPANETSHRKTRSFFSRIFRPIAHPIES